MIRMKLFLLNLKVFDLTNYDELLKSGTIAKGKERYAQKLTQREKELAPIEQFISEIGFENVRKITTTSDVPSVLTYTIFYEDNQPKKAY